MQVCRCAKNASRGATTKDTTSSDSSPAKEVPATVATMMYSSVPGKLSRMLGTTRGEGKTETFLFSNEGGQRTLLFIYSYIIYNVTHMEIKTRRTENLFFG